MSSLIKYQSGILELLWSASQPSKRITKHRFIQVHPSRNSIEKGFDRISWLQPIVAAASAGHNTALPALIDKLRQGVMALLAAVLSLARSPSGMCALVVLNQILSFTADQVGPVKHVRIWVPVDHGFGTCKQVVFVPLCATAILPLRSANIAELSATEAGYLSAMGIFRTS